jgi:taurine dioxygenase
MSLDITPLPQALGASVTGLDLSDGVRDDDFARLHAAWLENLVLFFPGLHLTLDQHIELGSRFGRLAATTRGDDDYRNQTTLGPAGEVLVLDAAEPAGRANAWHTDVTFTARPPKGSLLSMVVSPDKGGDTIWSNQYAAYEALHPALRDMLDGLSAVHGRPGLTGSTVHPMVVTHPETGRRALFVNRGWMLFDHCEKPEFSTRWSWRAGDAALWDNRVTMHYAVNDYGDATRIIHRVTIHDT